MSETLFTEIVEQIERSRLIAILRGFEAEQAAPACAALVAGGVRVLEISLVDDSALQSISAVRQELGERCIVGAGTVMTQEQAERAAEAGAQFLFSPGLNAQVLAVAQAHGILAIPGVLTPSEIMSALAADLPLVKLFPAEPLGPQYLRQLRGPFPSLRAIATGGVGPKNAAAYLAAGAVALGAGSHIANADWARVGAYHRFQEAASTFLGSLFLQDGGASQ